MAADIPQLADDYRADATQAELARKYEIEIRYGLTPSVAETAVYYALRELIPEAEREELRMKHNIDAARRTQESGIGLFSQTPEQLSEAGRKGGKTGGRAGGQKTYELGVGIHALTREQRVKFGRRAGKIGGANGGRIGGQAAYRMGVGIHGMSPEKKTDAGQKAAMLRGQVPWSPEEKAYLMELCADPTYQRSYDSTTVPDYAKIATLLQEKFGTARTYAAVNAMRNYMERKKRRAQSR